MGTILLLVLIVVTLAIQIFKFVRDLKEIRARKLQRDKLYKLLIDIDYGLYDLDNYELTNGGVNNEETKSND